jgi:ABC-type uncharacterized transport system auxiliary subunit
MKWLVLLACAACAGKMPETRYYQLAEPKPLPPLRSGAAIVIEPLATDTAYDDERIVYRVTPYRLDYYNYHRWSSTPGTLIANYLERAFEHSGKFSAVTHDPTPEATLVLGGRVAAIEEVDQSSAKWVGRIVLELKLTDTTTNKVIWSEQYEEVESLATRSPEGLARALSTALDRIALRAVPSVAVIADEQMRVQEKRAARR